MAARPRGAAVPHGIVFTDFSAHPQWIHAGLERYFVPTEAVRAGVVAQGISPDRVVTSGLPVDSAFTVPPERLALRAALGLPADVPVVLVTGGMRGLLRGVADACEALASLDRGFVALAVCGDHRRLAARLRRRYDGDRRFRILDRASDMASVMGAADLVVSKAGAMTCAEALALGRPLLLHRSLPGQERANEDCLVAAGAALRARNGRELRRRLDALLSEPELRAALAATARSLRRPEGAAPWPRRCSVSWGGDDGARRVVGRGCGCGRRGVGRVRLGSAVRLARGRLAARAGGEAPGRPHVR